MESLFRNRKERQLFNQLCDEMIKYPVFYDCCESKVSNFLSNHFVYPDGSLNISETKRFIKLSRKGLAKVF